MVTVTLLFPTETDLPIVAAACVYVAAKSEETAIHIKVVVSEARATFSGQSSPYRFG